MRDDLTGITEGHNRSNSSRNVKHIQLPLHLVVDPDKVHSVLIQQMLDMQVQHLEHDKAPAQEKERFSKREIK